MSTYWYISPQGQWFRISTCTDLRFEMVAMMSKSMFWPRIICTMLHHGASSLCLCQVLYKVKLQNSMLFEVLIYLLVYLLDLLTSCTVMAASGRNHFWQEYVPLQPWLSRRLHSWRTWPCRVVNLSLRVSFGHNPGCAAHPEWCRGICPARF